MKTILPGTYTLKTQFFGMLNISKHQYENRKQDLLEWLKDFFDYTIDENSRPIIITIKEVYEDYKPLPPKNYNIDKRRLDKERDYTQFVRDNLPEEFKPLSKAKMTRDAINAFGMKKYGHQSVRSVTNRYVGPAMDEYGEHDDKMLWVRHNTYEPIVGAELDDWHSILREEHISEDEMRDAFVRYADGENIDAEVSYFKVAQERFAVKYGGRPIKVYSWKVKK